LVAIEWAEWVMGWLWVKVDVDVAVNVRLGGAVGTGWKSSTLSVAAGKSALI